MASIEIDKVSVSYMLRRWNTSKEATGGGKVGAQVRQRRGYLEIAALRDVSLSLKTGDRVGLIGINGSGKSTLLKLCAGAVSPQSGTITIDGKVSPQFGLGSGLKPGLSGRQNAELKCLYLGVPQGSIKTYVEDVKGLSGLGDYFELPIKSYSAGMKSRLVMSLLRLMKGEILIMDEWINAADPTLNKAVGGLQKQLVQKAQILMLATHSTRTLLQSVATVLWLHSGEVRAYGPVREVLREYKTWLRKA